MKKILNVFVCTLSLIPMIGFGQIVKTVEASGAGSSEKSALLDASRNAVSQVVNTLIESQTTTLDEDIVEDKIISVSGGFIDNMKVIEPATKNDSGIYTIKIKADVKYDQLSTEIAKYSSSSKKIDMKSIIGKHDAKEKEARLEKLVKEEQQEEMGEFLIKLIDDYVRTWKFDVEEIAPGSDDQEIVLNIQGTLTNDDYISKFNLPTQKRLKALNIIAKKSNHVLVFYLRRDILSGTNGQQSYPIEIFNWKNDNKSFTAFCADKMKAVKYILRIELKNADGEALASKDVEFGRHLHSKGYKMPLLNLEIGDSSILITPHLSADYAKKNQNTKMVKSAHTLRVFPPNKITDITSVDVKVLQVDAKSPCDEKWYK